VSSWGAKRRRTYRH